MKAVDFIRKFGWEKVRDGIRNIEPYEKYLIGIYNSDLKEIEGVFYIDRTPYKANVDDLKQYVDAWDLVYNFGGLKRAKRILKKSYTQFNTRVSVVWNDKPFQCSVEQLEQATQLVEEVYYGFN